MDSPIKIYAETERLILRSWSPEDLPTFIAVNKDARVMKHFPATLDDNETEVFYDRIQNKFEQNDWGLYAVELKALTCK